jgi:hypothetical protein
MEMLWKIEKLEQTTYPRHISLQAREPAQAGHTAT